MMLVAGASRHAKEILEILYQTDKSEDLVFFDDVSKDGPILFYNKYPVLRSLEDAAEQFRLTPSFVLGLGNPVNRYKVLKKLTEIGGNVQSVISNTSNIGHYDIQLGLGLNIMNFVMISNSVHVGDGSLLNAYSCIHHDVFIEEFCEISPRATLLGGVTIGRFTSIGCGAIILPDVSVGENVIIGAGAVVTKNIASNKQVIGIPAKVVKDLDILKL